MACISTIISHRIYCWHHVLISWDSCSILSSGPFCRRAIIKIWDSCKKEKPRLNLKSGTKRSRGWTNGSSSEETEPKPWMDTSGRGEFNGSRVACSANCTSNESWELCRRIWSKRSLKRRGGQKLDLWASKYFTLGRPRWHEGAVYQAIRQTFN